VLTVLVGGILAVPPLECPPPDPSVPSTIQAHAPAVQLWLAPIWLLDGRAVHPHFLYAETAHDSVHRVEVWQSAHGPHHHLLVDRIRPMLDQQRGLCHAGTVRGDKAREVIAALKAAPDRYPWKDIWVPAPGPNSNTFAAAILDESNWELTLPIQAIGQRFWVP